MTIITTTTITPCQLPPCILLNNQAAQLFQKGDYLQAAKIFRRASCLLLEILPELTEEEKLAEKPRWGALKIKIHIWSMHSPGRSSSRSQSMIFVHQRAAFLCPRSFCPDLYWLYSSFVLYNLGVSCQQVAIVSNGVCISNAEGTHSNYASIGNVDVLFDKAIESYNIAFEALKKSKNSHAVLLTVIINNHAHVLYQRGMMYDATRYFRVLRDLIKSSKTRKMFENRDYCGLYLNSLFSSNTASAA